VLGSFVLSPKALRLASDELSDQDVQHHFIDFLLPALLGFGRLPYSAAASRRALAAFGADLRRP